MIRNIYFFTFIKVECFFLDCKANIYHDTYLKYMSLENTTIVYGRIIEGQVKVMMESRDDSGRELGAISGLPVLV